MLAYGKKEKERNSLFCSPVTGTVKQTTATTLSALTEVKMESGQSINQVVFLPNTSFYLVLFPFMVLFVGRCFAQ